MGNAADLKSDIENRNKAINISCNLRDLLRLLGFERASKVNLEKVKSYLWVYGVKCIGNLSNRGTQTITLVRG